MKRTLTACLVLSGLAGLAAAPLVHAEDPAPAPAPQVATQEQILAWVGQLGSDDFRQREEASAKLEQAGAAAREALETAVKTSESLEVRWRAQQLLLRLDGRRERPMGGVEPGPRGGPAAPGADDLRKLFEADTPERVRELMERLMQGFGTRPELLRGGLAPLAGWDLFNPALTSGDLTLRSGMPGGRVTLEVRGQDASGAPTRTTYEGASLEAILQANPALANHPSLPGLRQAIERQKQLREPRALMPGMRMPMFSFQSSEGIEIQQDGSGATVRLREKGPDGQIVTKEFKGATLDEIRTKHPELADRLGGFQVHVGPSRVFRGPREEPLPPLPAPEAQPELTPPSSDEPRFGVRLAPLDDLLARHLKLDRSSAVLVGEVVPDSQAAALGLEVLDILESIDGTPLASLEDAVQRLRAAARAKGPLTLGILRSGLRQTLTR